MAAMFCTVSMGDPWHSYIGSTSVFPDYLLFCAEQYSWRAMILNNIYKALV